MTKHVPVLEKNNESFTLTTKQRFFLNLKNSLVKTREIFESSVLRLLYRRKIDDNVFKELEELLLISDVGIETTHKIINALITHVSYSHFKNATMLYSQLRTEMTTLLCNVEKNLNVITSQPPFVLMIIGVNGVGKTTIIGKLAYQYKSEGKKIMLVAGDTFRVAGIEQLKIWGKKNNVPVIAQKIGADAASVIFDAMQSAQKNNIDILIVDTAGRLQNKVYLMEELKKIIRVMKKINTETPHEIMLIIDVNTGQNAINQVHFFNENIKLTGISLTKLDGTAKGGVIFTIANRFNIPIRYVSIGEGIKDLQPFKYKDFINAFLPENINKNGY